VALNVVQVSTGYPTSGFSLPDLISLCIRDDDGTGGALYLNGLGVTNILNNSFDLKLLFTGVGLVFNSYPLLRAFRAVNAATGNAEMLAQVAKYLEINYYPIAGGAIPLRFVPIAGLGGDPPTVSYLQIIAAVGTIGDTWRLNLKLRHTVTN